MKSKFSDSVDTQTIKGGQKLEFPIDVTPILRREIGIPPRAWVQGKERVKRDYHRAVSKEGVSRSYSF